MDAKTWSLGVLEDVYKAAYPHDGMLGNLDCVLKFLRKEGKSYYEDFNIPFVPFVGAPL